MGGVRPPWAPPQTAPLGGLHRPADVDVKRTMTDLDVTPTQQRTLEALRRQGAALRFDAGEIAELVAYATSEVAVLSDRLDAHTLVVAKHDLSGILGCETHHVHRDPFDWSARNACGSVVHRAIQLQLNWRGDPLPVQLVDEAIDRLTAEDNSLAAWLNECSPADIADLRGFALDSVTRFMESFPPLQPEWTPVVEARVMWPAAGPIQFRGRVDLMLGRPSGTESRKVFVDVKTGARATAHALDLHYYALIETLSRLVPPRALASFYLDAAEAVVEDVTMPALHASLRRALAATERLIEVDVEGRTPTKQPGWSCRWCPVAEGCQEGQAWLAKLDVS